MKQSKPRKSDAVPANVADTPVFIEPATLATPMELNLANHFLIAMPSVLDPVFGGTVVYICEHNERGALGVVINKPTDMTMDTLFDRIELRLDIAPIRSKAIMFGGPVQDDRGFVLHTPAGEYSSSLHINDELAFTTSRDVLEAVATGLGPDRLLVSVGYSGWSPGQLEDEIARNGWLTVMADTKVIFDLPVEQRYVAAIKLLGIDPMMLAAEGGRA